jgi:NADPH:quinone reductase-like Zn-dependent oxidoreductase
MKRVMTVRIAEPCDGLALVEVPEPQPGPGEVLVEVKARPIQPADLLIVRGRHLVRPPLPDPVGIEGAGIVVGHGRGVSHPPLGSLVALPFGGTWAERIVVPADAPILLPEGSDVLQAAMLALNPVTAFGLLDGLQPGQWLLHNAASSSLGQLITRLASARGIPSISVVRRESMAPELLELGADHVLVDGDDLAQRVLALTGGSGVRRALDAVAGRATGRLFDATSDDGEVVCYGLLGDDEIVLPAARAIFRSVTVRGYSRLRALRAMPTGARAAMQREIVADFERGLFETPVVATFPLARLREAVTLAESTGGRGKVLLVSPDLLGTPAQP